MMHVEVLLGHRKAEDRVSGAMQLDVVESVFTQTFMGTCFVPKSSLGGKYTSEFKWLFCLSLSQCHDSCGSLARYEGGC